ncbi:hypothetical protein B7Y94_00400 [Candidatus Saccharibacteria bacterium 32-49-12]|nr:MAG: hypothetical protein B7Y94_00400 [Candidatus Saccharibacteria bacterium 32-49-12]
MSSSRIERKLANLTREFFARHPSVKLVAVTGSAGKTSAKVAIATVLSRQYNVQLREEEPLTKSEVFLQIMGVVMPKRGPLKWYRALRAVKKRVRAKAPEVQVIVQEFSPKQLGYNGWFQKYLLPDITVVTSVTNGRMQVEHRLEAVANEMITLANNSRTALINRDDIEGRFAAFLTNPQISTYGTNSVAEYHFDEHNFSIESGHQGVVISPENNQGLAVDIQLLGEHNLRPAIAAAAVGYKLGVSEENIKLAIDSLRPLPGRMNMLRGAGGSWLIDDSYSSTPLTALSALQSLYTLKAPQRIAVLGNMNGLKGIFEQAHTDIGEACDPYLLDWVVTVGEKANQHLAPAARRKGCQVKECRDALEAGAFIREHLKTDGIALFKGSSGGVWLEEAIKMVLQSTTDESQLVRQSKDWLTRKNSFFEKNRLIELSLSKSEKG